MVRGLLSVLESGGFALGLSAVILVGAVGYGFYTNIQAKDAEAVAPVEQQVAPAQ